MATENKIQEIVHKLEEGGWVKWIRLFLLLAVIGYISSFWFFRDNGFKGLKSPEAMEHAQIARELTRGNGFSTNMIRPAAIWQFLKYKGAIPEGPLPDTYHAPLNPAVEAVAFMTMGKLQDLFASLGGKFSLLVFEKEMTTKSVIFAYDKIAAFVQLLFFLLAVLVNYFTAKLLFDRRLALLGMWLMLACDLFWQYSMSGLPQMLMLFLFSGATYCLVRAVSAHCHIVAEQAHPHSDSEIPAEARAPVPVSFWARPLPWLIATAVLFGLLALTHAMTIWIFAGALLFVLLYFRPFGRAAVIMAAIFLVIYTPWLVRNYQVCGSPVGLGWYAGLYQIRGTEGAIMRSMDPPLTGVQPYYFREKVQNQILGQIARLPAHLGWLLVAPVFFVALLHLFRRRETAVFRWCVLLMWLAATFGMAVFGLESDTMDPNDLHVLFIPLLTFYGLAFLLVQWTRLEIRVPLLRIAFLTMIFLLSSLPFLRTVIELHRDAKTRVQWPPYVPPYISVLAQWTNNREVIMSDMPWAVGWYADRKSLWLPMTLGEFNDLHDYNKLRSRIVGLYLTPVSGNQPFISTVMKGDYQAWSPLIMRNPNVKGFPFRAVTALPLDNECIFYADRDRWSAKED